MVVLSIIHGALKISYLFKKVFMGNVSHNDLDRHPRTINVERSRNIERLYSNTFTI